MTIKIKKGNTEKVQKKMKKRNIEGGEFYSYVPKLPCCLLRKKENVRLSIYIIFSEEAMH